MEIYNNNPSQLIYKDYLNLFIHCIHTNLEKAILIGRALNSK
jgi:hypothetical protein